MSRSLTVHHLASKLSHYSQGLRIQAELEASRKAGQIGDQLLLLQHTPVYTVGKRGTENDFIVSEQELRAQGAEIERIGRGGEVTFHGPGQLVAYPISNIRELKVGARAWVEGLENSIVNTVNSYGVEARGQVSGRTGVWVQERKIAALGVKISRGISTHGMALNVNTDLSFFSNIVPCGLSDKEVTSLAQETGQDLDLDEVAAQLAWAFAKEFCYDSCVDVLG